jgi:hypothetical protein
LTHGSSYGCLVICPCDEHHVKEAYPRGCSLPHGRQEAKAGYGAHAYNVCFSEWRSEDCGLKSAKAEI